MNTITCAQQKQFWVAFSAACRNLGISGCADKEKYRKEVLKKDGGVEHLKDLDRTGGYDKVMVRLSVDAGLYEAACKYLASTAKRFIAVIRVKATEIAGEAHWLDYVNGVKDRAGLRDRSFEDLTDTELRAIIAILDTHHRRCVKACQA